MRTSPKLPTSPAGLASHSTSSRTKFPVPRTPPWPPLNASPDPSRRSGISNWGSRPQNASNSWCTGKDSNLRTSLGGTDLQSVGFNHSPTCAKMPSLPALITQVSVAGLPVRSDAASGRLPNRKTECARKSSRTQTPHLEKFLMECCWEKSVTPPRRAKPYIPEPPRLNRRIDRIALNQMLELAKGFEPPTL